MTERIGFAWLTRKTDRRVSRTPLSLALLRARRHLGNGFCKAHGRNSSSGASPLALRLRQYFDLKLAEYVDPDAVRLLLRLPLRLLPATLTLPCLLLNAAQLEM